MAGGPYLVGVDIGTTGAKTTVFDTAGANLGSGYREYGCTYPKPNWVEQDAEMLVAASFAATREALSKAGVKPGNVAAVSFSTQRTCTHFLDGQGRLVRPMISWQDNRPVEEVETIRRELGAERFHAITCLPLGAIWILGKILWLRKNEPENWKRVRRIVQLQDYFLKAYGSDDYTIDYSDAGLFGLWDLYAARWSGDILERFKIDAGLLPRPTRSGTTVGAVSKAVADSTGLAAGTPLVVGAGDQNAAAVGAGTVEPGMLSVSLGTGGLAAAFLAAAPPRLDPQGMLTAHPIPGAYMLEGYQPAGASALRWFRDEVAALETRDARAAGEDPYERLTALAAAVPPGAKGLLMVPHFASAATPRWNPHSRAALVGMTFAHDRACLIRAAMEGITLDVRDMIRAMVACGADIRQVRILGGPTRSALWNQIQADVYGHPVQTLRQTDAAVLGAAILAGVGAGVFPDIRSGVKKMVAVDRTFDPIPAHVAVYDELYAAFCAVYEGLNLEAFERIAKFQSRC